MKKITSILLMLPALYLLMVVYTSLDGEVISALNIVFLIIVSFVIGLLMLVLEVSKGKR